MTIDPTISEWLNLIFRWVHVFAGIMWVGTTYYFTWLDARLSEEEKAVANTGQTAQIWMVHSGGFYVVEKRKVPDLVSRTLHWFRWEAGTTWLSGAALLIVILQNRIISSLGEGAQGGVSGATLPDAARERVAVPLAEAFAHTYWYALALTAAALVPGLLRAREEARARRKAGAVKAPVVTGAIAARRAAQT